MSIYDNLTDEQIKDIIREAAKENPAMLTSALRAAGNFVYLIVPEDIQDRINEDPEEYSDFNGITDEEIGNALSERGDKLSDLVDYGSIVSDILDWMRIVRNENNNG